MFCILPAPASEPPASTQDHKPTISASGRNVMLIDEMWDSLATIHRMLTKILIDENVMRYLHPMSMESAENDGE